MRGTPDGSTADVTNLGIIPAYAGNTIRIGKFSSHHKDHPRVCGEHCVGRSNHLRPTGSSPRMRGTQRYGSTYEQAAGIIPAYAGNTRIALFRFRKTWDHPRVCGEHTLTGSPRSTCKGSSPRMRGTPFFCFTACRCFGIIPAYAGNTEP